MTTVHNDDVKFAVLVEGIFTQWYKHLSMYLPKFGVAGKSILNGKKQVPSFPKPDDMLLDEHGVATLIQLYEHTPVEYYMNGAVKKPLAFIKDGEKDFKKAVLKYADIVAAYNVTNNQLTNFILVHLGSDVSKGLHANQLFVDALHKDITDTYDMVDIIKAQYSKGTGRTVVRQLQQFLGAQQGTLSHEAYVEFIKDNEITTRANYESIVHPGFIAISDITAAIYLNGLDPLFFKFKLENTYVSNPTGRFTDAAPLMADYQIYAREHRDDSTSPTQYSSALVAKSVSGVVKKCTICSGPVQGLDKKGLPYTRCLPCSRALWSKNSHAKPGPIVNKPTAAQLLDIRAMVAAEPDDDSF